MSSIPKVIHYCWFGGNPLPRSARRCIASWQKFFPDYEIREWNEGNFDVNMIPYTAEAYRAKKYAFVSDFARFWVLHEYGGLYFDTDVEVIASMDDILQKGAYMGMEAKLNPAQERFYVAPGLGIACEAGNPVWAQIIAAYKRFEYFDAAVQGTVCVITTNILAQYGIELKGELEVCEHLTIYPPDYFCPQAMYGAPICLTANTRSIHHFDCTWLPASTRLRLKIGSVLPPSCRKFLRALFYSS